jgi:PST family polysaccharide transporter
MLSVAVGQGSSYLSYFVLAVLLPPRDFGVLAIAATVVNFTTLLLTSGTGGSLIIAPSLSATWVRRALLRTTVAGLIATLLVVAAATPIANAFAGGAGVAAFRVIAIAIGLASVAIVPNALLSRHLRFKTTARISMAAALVTAVATIVAAALGAGIWALVIRLVAYQFLITVFTCIAARDLLPRGPVAKETTRRHTGRVAFLMIAVASFIAWSCDNLVVGAFTNTTQLGIYALAFTLAFAPLTQVAWTVGQVLLPTIAAARSPLAVQRQTLKAVRITALMLLPLVPAAVAVAPGLVPLLLGRKWDAMVVPFQILILVGVGQGLLNTLGESLAGAGTTSVAVRARIDVIWALATIGAIVAGVTIGGIRGAAVAHFVTFCGLAVAYTWRGGRSIGLSVTRICGAVQGVAACVAVQAMVTAAVTAALSLAGSGWIAAGVVGAAVGVAAFAAILRLRFPSLLEEGAGVVAAVRGRSG